MKPLFDELKTTRWAISSPRNGPRQNGSNGAKRVLIACHIDELVFTSAISTTRDSAEFKTSAGSTRAIICRRVRVQASGGEDLLFGLNESERRPTHIAKDEEKKESPERSSSMSSVSPAATVLKKVRIGDPVTLVQGIQRDRATAYRKCMDDRVASFVAIEALKKAKIRNTK